jgi:hypothetical protein
VVFGPLYLMVYAHRKPVAEIGSILDAAAVIMQRIPALARVPGTAPDLPSGV